MVYQRAMFTHRICCCSATVASQTMAIISLVLGAITAIGNWFFSTSPIYLDIFGTVIVAIQVAACVLVFIAVCTTRPAFMLPILVIQANLERYQHNCTCNLGSGRSVEQSRCVGSSVLPLNVPNLLVREYIRLALSRLLLQGVAVQATHNYWFRCANYSIRHIDRLNCSSGSGMCCEGNAEKANEGDFVALNAENDEECVDRWENGGRVEEDVAEVAK